MLVGVVLIYGPEQAANLPQIRTACAGLDGLVVVSGEPIPGAVPPSPIQGFNAGANRDIGIAEARRRFPGCSVLLLDGDCIPGPIWAESHRAACGGPRPTIACGARNEGTVADPRTRPLTWQGTAYPPSFVPGGRSDCSLEEIVAHRVTWTCNLSINAAALDLLEAAGPRIHGHPRIFAPMFDGQWGGEDTGLGILAWYLGCRIESLDPEESYVEHQPHPSRVTSLRNLRTVDDYEQQVIRALAPDCYIAGTPPTEQQPRRLEMDSVVDQVEKTEIAVPRTCSQELLTELRALESHAKAYEAQADTALAQAEALRRHGSLRAQQVGEMQPGEVLDLASGIISAAPTK